MKSWTMYLQYEHVDTKTLAVFEAAYYILQTNAICSMYYLLHTTGFHSTCNMQYETVKLI